MKESRVGAIAGRHPGPDELYRNLFVDTETDGLERSARLFEVAVVDGADVVLIDTLVSQDPPFAFPSWSPLNKADLASAPTPEVVLTSLARILERRVVWSFNAAFDRRVLWSAYQLLERPAPRCRWRCAATLAQIHFGTRLTLAQVASRCEVEVVEPPHRALSDARTLRTVVHALTALDA